MAEKTLSFDQGVVTYNVNGKAKISFNPTDANFTNRLYDTFTELDARQDEVQKQVESLGNDPKAVFAYVDGRDREMRATIDGLFGEGVADALFGDMNCYALADGLPMWINLFFAIAEEVNDAIEREHKRTDPRMQAYSRKYDKLMQKYKPSAPNRQISQGAR